MSTPIPPRRTEGDPTAPGPTDRRHLIGPTVRALSDRHGGLVVALLVVDRTSGTATPISVHDPDDAGLDDLTDLVGASIPLAGTICGAVVEGGRSIQVGSEVASDVPDEMLPDGWLRYAQRHQLRTVAVVPVLARRAVVGLLVAGRRETGPLAPELLAELEESSRRLGTLLAPTATATDDDRDHAPVDDLGAPRSTRRRATFATALDVVLGLVPPLLLALLSTTDDPNQFRPASVLVLATTALGLLRSPVASGVCAAASFGVLWLRFTDPIGSLAVTDASDLVGLGVATATLLTVQLLVARIAAARRREARERAVLEGLLTHLPIGFGLLDPDKRFRRVNPQLAELDGAPVGEHLGRRPGDVNPLIGELYEHLIDRVLDEGQPVVDEVVSFDVPETGLRHSWRVNQYPVAIDDEVVAVGTTVEDITDEMIVRRRAQLLLRLSRTVASARTAEEVAHEVTTVLADGLKARAAFAVSSDRGRAVLAVAGYRDADAGDQWRRFAAHPPPAGQLETCLRAGELVVDLVDPPGGQRRTGAEDALHRDLGNVTVAWQPVLRPGEDTATAALGVAWPIARRLTEHSRTLLQTAASITGLALDRIEVTARSERDRFRTAMDAMIDQVLLTHCLRDAQGQIVDFEIDFANETAIATRGGPDAVLGRRLGELYPRLRESGLFARFAEVVDEDVPWVVDRMAYRDRTPEGRVVDGHWNLQVVKVGDGFIIASRDVTDVVAAERMAEQARETAQRERIAVDLLQRAALPAELPEVGEVELAAHYRPARRQQPVGGDWYDAFVLDETRLALVIADVAGHGPEAAGTMVQVRNVLRAMAAEHEDPGEVLACVDQLLHRLSDGDAPFVTCCYAVLDTVGGCFRWASAGHLPPLVDRSEGGIELLEQRPGPPLGALKGGTFEVASTALQPGDLVVLYTDGLVERRGEVIDDGLARLLDQVGSQRGSTCEVVVQFLAQGVEAPTDDTAVLCARFGS